MPRIQGLELKQRFSSAWVAFGADHTDLLLFAILTCRKTGSTGRRRIDQEFLQMPVEFPGSLNIESMPCILDNYQLGIVSYMPA